jgi:hypothetical protein
MQQLVLILQKLVLILHDPSSLTACKTEIDAKHVLMYLVFIHAIMPKKVFELWRYGWIVIAANRWIVRILESQAATAPRRAVVACQ